MWMNALQHIKNRRVEAGEAALRNARLIHSEPRRPGADLDPILADSLLCRCLEDLKWKTTIQKCVGNICKLEFTPVKMDKAGVYSGQYIVYLGSWSLLRSNPAL